MIDQLISNIRSKLPLQNPLHTFVHNNILQMFEHKDFHEAVAEAGKLYRARPYWPIWRYFEKYEEKKITDKDIFSAIEHYLGHYPPIPSLDKLGLTPKEYFYRLMFAELSFNDDEIHANPASKHLWDQCREKMDGQELRLSRTQVFWRGKEYWEKYHGESYALTVHALIIRLISSYLDQGQSFWQNPFVKESFWNFFVFDILGQRGFVTSWRKELLPLVEQYQHLPTDQVIEAELRRKGIPQERWESYLLEILFDLKGWAGMVNKLEVEPWQATVKAPAIRLQDYIAAVLLAESAMDNYHAKANSIDLSMLLGREEKNFLGNFQLAFALYQISINFKLPERWMRDIPTTELLRLIDEIDQSEFVDRVRLWHEAYEHHFHREAIEAVAIHANHPVRKQQPYAQIYFCIDDREESMRRHLEELDHELETFGVVGFFGIDMKFSSLKNERLIAQCPPVIVPSRVVKEVPVSDAESFRRWNFLRGASDLGLYYHSRTLFRGFIASLVLGIASLVPMFVSVFFPQQSKNLRRFIDNLFHRPPETEIKLESGEAGEGYSYPEQAKIVEAVIRMCGYRPPLAELIIVLGHGSSSNNNPFKQAYGCGACGGNAGIPNSRTFAKMANDENVRAELAKLGVHLTPRTFFVAGFHDTCTDEIFYFNDQLLPVVHREKFERAKKSLVEAAKLNAYERCQRFSSFDDRQGPDKAIQHVRERAHDLAQPRPEYGHSSNALAIVAKRDLTKGLFMNRRSFLLSYDWETDPDGSVMRQVVLGGVPVAVNINMDYYFSAVDNDNFGCGSKLPLNMTSLLGVMTGSQSDLRIGLARQMIEIHEPIRNMTIIESPLDKVRSLFDSHPRLKNILYQHWMRLVVKDPVAGKWYIFTQKKFEEVRFEDQTIRHYHSSLDILKNHLADDFAEIDT